MDIWSWLQEVALLIVVCKISAAGGDFLENIRPKADNPPELNDFLNNVLDHKSDFYFVKEVARKYQKMKKDTHLMDSLDEIPHPFDYDNGFSRRYKFDDKRHVHHHHKRLKNVGFIQPSFPRNKVHRIRRANPEEQNANKEKRSPVEIVMLAKPQQDTVHKRMPVGKREKHIPSNIFVEPEAERLGKRTPEISVESEGEKGEIQAGGTKITTKEKKEAIDLNEAVHRTYKSNQKNRVQTDNRNRQNDFYYVDLGNAAEKAMDRDERRRYEWSPEKVYYRSGHDRAFKAKPHDEHLDYNYDNSPHRSLDDEIAFEKALSYELNPRYEETQSRYNNPQGNNLYSVDEGRPDVIEAVNQPPGRFDYPDREQASNERFFINSKNAMHGADSTTEGTTKTTETFEDSGRNQVKHIGNGFIEITKTKREIGQEGLADSNEKNAMSLSGENVEEKSKDKAKDQSSIMFKHSLHPLRVRDVSQVENPPVSEDEKFKSRKLKFIDAQMANLYDQEENYDDVPSRPKRDFLDALGMKNEEDYSEDNPYRDEMITNNTDVNNDTHIHEHTTGSHCGFTKTTTLCPHEKDDVKNIKTILEEPKAISAQKKKKKDKRMQSQKHLAQLEDFDDLLERRVRDTDVETKVFENKDKIYNPHESARSHRKVSFVQRRHMFPNRVKYKKKEVKKSIATDHRIHKKEDSDCLATRVTDVSEVTTEGGNCTSSNSSGSDYEKVAHQMDIENEKLAQVVNGRLASKIVSTVFDELKKKSCLKAKFYSGLSRKHVNFAGTIDFDIFKANETEDVSEARLLLDQITKVLNRLVLNQVRRKLCQRLPEELKEYLDVVLNVKNTLESNNFVPNANQGDFLFTYQDRKNIPFDMNRIQQTLTELQTLLSNYKHLNEECQGRAEPVKEYIEQHVQLLEKVKNCPDHMCDKLGETKRDTPASHDLVEKQLESLGLGRSHDFVPNFDVNRMVKNRLESSGWKTDKKRDLAGKSDFTSRQFQKLQLAAQKVREKRENDKKIAELFAGQKNKKRSVKKLDVDFEDPVVYSLG
ncbi:hypothetical protein TcasGA2_TC009867 [Tribolium castaneum]|uniref:Uncharacterized protein n=1 Tax=Tribolium castaneum TaxID=7070 RepID=D6WQ39_TRICA|nr:PREDICTED: uncharacterized protein LOC657893 [Tribolium castaneum]XP_015837687.1 PREDICTED: uncharacterized protein LOC657893 [Tribolium castaneum]EFA06918.2 hypothetical protein TcasGA2_TC009867 [Tribolium castaneum]|eukprot:XP_008195718.1 PREDICTED: uncharacterized protein LOC657893 [Tribolium castaneum]